MSESSIAAYAGNETRRDPRPSHDDTTTSFKMKFKQHQVVTSSPMHLSQSRLVKSLFSVKTILAFLTGNANLHEVSPLFLFHGRQLR